MNLYEIFILRCKNCNSSFSEEIEQITGPVKLGDFVLTQCPICGMINDNEIKGVYEKDS